MSTILDPAGYRYNHGTGQHYIVHEDEQDRLTPRYSLHCCLCQCLDWCIFIFVLAFLGGCFYLCYYIYNNYGSG